MIKNKYNVPQRLALLMNAKGLKQSELAARLGVPPSHLNHYLKGHGDIRGQLLVKILRELDLDIEDLLQTELAHRLSLEKPARESPAQSFETIVKSLRQRERVSLISYIQKYARENLSAEQRPRIRRLRELE